MNESQSQISIIVRKFIFLKKEETYNFDWKYFDWKEQTTLMENTKCYFFLSESFLQIRENIIQDLRSLQR